MTAKPCVLATFGEELSPSFTEIAGFIIYHDGVLGGHLPQPVMRTRNAKQPQFHVPCWRVLREEKLVELWRRHGRTRQHGVCLPAVVDLVDEQVAENGGHRLPMVDAVVAVHRDDASKVRCIQAVAHGHQPPVGFELSHAKCCRRVGQFGPADGGAAETGQVGKVAAVNEEDVLQRLAQRGEEADSGGRERLRA